jgi:hypothetical protein
VSGIEWTGRFETTWRLLELRLWWHWWHWFQRSKWRLTRFEGADGRPCGTWLLQLGPLTVRRMAILREKSRKKEADK